MWLYSHGIATQIVSNQIDLPPERDLRAWIEQEEAVPAEEMAGFFAARLAGYEDVHMGNWGEMYRAIAGYFDEGLTTLLDIGCGKISRERTSPSVRRKRRCVRPAWTASAGKALCRRTFFCTLTRR